MNQQPEISAWLPTNRQQMASRGWSELDVIIITGDAYVDHPSFGHAVIGRIIESEGLRVGIIPQPNWRDDRRDFKRLGEPRLFFGVTSGCMDSMVNHYTAQKRRRWDDAYTPGGESGFRPDYATSVYSLILKELFPDTPVILGGIEASLRRCTHYDYWSDTLKPSILVDSRADLIVYGMGEGPLREIIRLMKRGVPISSLTNIPQTAFLLAKNIAPSKNKRWQTVVLNSHEECLLDKRKFAEDFKLLELESNRVEARRITQAVGRRTLVINPPYPTMSTKELDDSFDLPYTRLPHPRYLRRGKIPAFEMIKFSVNIHRGCFGGCAFCTISAHQGRKIISRSENSILREVTNIINAPDFKGYISDLGGPSANMYGMKGKLTEKCQACQRPSCVYPSICTNLDSSHERLLGLYRLVNQQEGLKRAFVSSGIRYDLFLSKMKNDRGNHYARYLKELILNHTSGRLKVAPEHTSPSVLKIMRKPSFDYFKELKFRFDAICAGAGVKQELIPYFISSHPGSSLSDMDHLVAETKQLGFKLEQVQDFTPTPMTLATAIYYSGIDPYTSRAIHCVKSSLEKKQQRDRFFWYQNSPRGGPNRGSSKNK